MVLQPLTHITMPVSLQMQTVSCSAAAEEAAPHGQNHVHGEDKGDHRSQLYTLPRGEEWLLGRLSVLCDPATFHIPVDVLLVD